MTDTIEAIRVDFEAHRETARQANVEMLPEFRRVEVLLDLLDEQQARIKELEAEKTDLLDGLNDTVMERDRVQGKLDALREGGDHE